MARFAFVHTLGPGASAPCVPALRNFAIVAGSRAGICNAAAPASIDDLP
jgi:hypothetical protein